MISTAIYARYARSLVDVVIEKQAESEVKRDLELYLDIFGAVPDLLTAFDNPAVPRDSKEKLLAELVAHYPVGPSAANFLRILLANNRIRHFREIVEYYTKALNERKGVLSASVTSAAPLSENEIRILGERLGERLGRAVTLSVSENPGLLGGLVVQIGSTVYDGSIKTQLAEVKQRMMDPGVRL